LQVWWRHPSWPTAARGSSSSIRSPEHFLGGQAFWSLGGLFLVDTPEQRRMGIRDSRELALNDWMGSAQFDRKEDYWPRKWAEAYVDFAAGEMRSWLHAMGMRWFPIVGWAEGRVFRQWSRQFGAAVSSDLGRGAGHVEPFEKRVRAHAAAGRITLRFRHRCSALLSENGAVTGVAGRGPGR
jgi:predicted oxidoreductase